MSEQLLKQILEELQHMNSRFDTLETRMSTFESEVSTLGTRMSTFESEVSTLGTRMSTLEVNMEQGFEDIRNKLNTIENQVAFASELQSPVHDLQQQVKDHEADIKLLKRVVTNQ